ncbi:hypothetical protein C7N43_15700 [Sphingobacteriales bacterium UPWRP_1]|nr:hypothetical protein BVG80_04345 [Sphingobacteriales bacterium TSM_CSM]PSJ76052.1 hypothetical protein C7N43_15700 [Sphingobacteriales bacterium UPWRP_1]
MSKEKLSAAELQLLISHYQRKVKKAGKKIVSLEKKQAKMRNKIEKLFALQNESETETEKPAETAETTESKPVIEKTAVAEAPKMAVEEKAVKKPQTVKEEAPAVEPVKEEKKEPLSVKSKVSVSSSGVKRPTTPGQWNEYVISVIAKNDRPTLTREIYEAALHDFSFSEEEMLMEERSIAKSLNVLSAKTGDLQKFKEGKMRGFYYCLPQWFYASGEMKKMYYKRIPRSED